MLKVKTKTFNNGIDKLNFIVYNINDKGKDGKQMKTIKLTRTQEIDVEIRNQAVRLQGQCCALFELPLMIYAQIMDDNTLRRKPYRVSENRIRRIIAQMVDAGQL